MEILVTGGAGFIGSHLCRYLVNNGHKVIIYDNIDNEKLDLIKKIRLQDIFNKVKIIPGDICDFQHVFKTLKENNVDCIIHTAAITFIPTAVENPSLAFKVNVDGSFNLLEASRVLNLKKFVYISTSSVYGDFQHDLVNENHPLEPKDIYGATKLASDRIMISYSRTYGMDVSVVRTTSVYGPGDLEKRAARNFIENALTGKEICLQGGGLQKRDFSYVKDVARGIGLTALSDKTKGEVIHISGGGSSTIKELAEVICKYIPNVKVVETPARDVDVSRGALDISKAKKIVNYVPEYNLEKGIKDYIKWFINVQAPAFGLEIKNKPVLE